MVSKRYAPVAELILQHLSWADLAVLRLTLGNEAFSNVRPSLWREKTSTRANSRTLVYWKTINRCLWKSGFRPTNPLDFDRPWAAYDSDDADDEVYLDKTQSLPVRWAREKCRFSGMLNDDYYNRCTPEDFAKDYCLLTSLCARLAGERETYHFPLRLRHCKAETHEELDDYDGHQSGASTPDHNQVWRTGSDDFLFSEKECGREIGQLFRPLANETVASVAFHPHLQVVAFSVVRENDSFSCYADWTVQAYGSAPPRGWINMVVNYQPPVYHNLSGRAGGFHFSWSPTGEHLLVGHRRFDTRVTDTDIFEFDAAVGSLKKLNNCQIQTNTLNATPHLWIDDYTILLPPPDLSGEKPWTMRLSRTKPAAVIKAPPPKTQNEGAYGDYPSGMYIGIPAAKKAAFVTFCGYRGNLPKSRATTCPHDHQTIVVLNATTFEREFEVDVPGYVSSYVANGNRLCVVFRRSALRPLTSTFTPVIRPAAALVRGFFPYKEIFGNLGAGVVIDEKLRRQQSESDGRPAHDEYRDTLLRHVEHAAKLPFPTAPPLPAPERHPPSYRQEWLTHENADNPDVSVERLLLHVKYYDYQRPACGLGDATFSPESPWNFYTVPNCFFYFEIDVSAPGGRIEKLQVLREMSLIQSRYGYPLPHPSAASTCQGDQNLFAPQQEINNILGEIDQQYAKIHFRKPHLLETNRDLKAQCRLLFNGSITQGLCVTDHLTIIQKVPFRMAPNGRGGNLILPRNHPHMNRIFTQKEGNLYFHPTLHHYLFHPCAISHKFCATGPLPVYELSSAGALTDRNRHRCSTTSANPLKNDDDDDDGNSGGDSTENEIAAALPERKRVERLKRRRIIFRYTSDKEIAIVRRYFPSGRAPPFAGPEKSASSSSEEEAA